MAGLPPIEGEKRQPTIKELLAARGLQSAPISELRVILGERRALVCEGKSWFDYIYKDFHRLRGLDADSLTRNDDFWLALGLLGNHADLDRDDVDYA